MKEKEVRETAVHVTPLHDRVLVRLLEGKETTKGAKGARR